MECRVRSGQRRPVLGMPSKLLPGEQHGPGDGSSSASHRRASGAARSDVGGGSRVVGSVHASSSLLGAVGSHFRV